MPQGTPATQPPPTSAVTRIEAPTQAVTVLDDFPEARYNRLVPTVVVMQQNPYLTPVVSVVQLDVERDTYHTTDMKGGHNALSKTGLRKLASVAVISVVEQYRSDDRSDPEAVEVFTKVAMTLPSGHVITATGLKRQDLNVLPLSKDNPAAHRAKLKMTLFEMAATKSELRAIRALLSLQSSYPLAELRKPWAVVHYVPNMDDPEVRRAMLSTLLPAAAQVYGGDPAAQLTAGPQQPVNVTEAPAAPDDDDDPSQTASGADTVTTADGQTVVVATGEILDFGSSDDGPLPLAERLTAGVALAEKTGYQGGATAPQKEALQVALGQLGKDDATLVITRTFGIERLSALTAAQAQSILDASTRPEFVAAWHDLATEYRG